MSDAALDTPGEPAVPAVVVEPIIVTYCTVCLLPCEFCEFGPAPAKCKEILARQNPALFTTLYPDESVEAITRATKALDALHVTEDSTIIDDNEGEEDDKKKEGSADELAGEEGSSKKKKKQRGGKGLVENVPPQGPDADPVPPPNPPSGKKKKSSEPKVVIKTETKAKKKSVTIVTGLDLFGVDLKKAAKSYASKFACGASVVKNPSNVEEIVIQGDVPDRVSELILKDHGDKISKEVISFVVK